MGESVRPELSAKAYGEAIVATTATQMFYEWVPWILTCLSKVSEEEVWYRPNEETVSIGNMILHLCGNVRQ